MCPQWHGVAEDDNESNLKFDDGTDFTKAVGLAWDTVSDQLLFFLSVFHSA